MALVDLAEVADKEEEDFYGKVYDYAFKKLKRDVRLVSEDIQSDMWSNDGVWFVVYGRSLHALYENTIWWGVEGTIGNNLPLMTQMRVKVPKCLLNELGYSCNNSLHCFKRGLDLKLWKWKSKKAKLKTLVGKAIYGFMIQHDGQLKIALGYGTLPLVEAKTIEELLIAADLDCSSTAENEGCVDG